MKIAFFHELHFGGARRVVLEYAREFSKDHEVYSYYTSKQKETDLDKLFKQANYYQFDHAIYEGGNWRRKIYKDFLEPIKLYYLHKKIAKEIDSKNYDFVLVHLSRFTHAPFILRFLKTPAFYLCHEPLRTAHDPVVEIPRNINKIKSIYEFLARKYRKIIDVSNAKKAHLIITNSEYSRSNILSAYGKKAEVSYLGVNNNVFKPLKVKKVYDIIFVGEDVWMEGYDLLEDVVKMFKTKPIVKVIKSEKGKYISDEKLSQEYNKSRICVVFGRFDPFTMIPLEAMACAVPSVLVNEGGGVEAIKDGRNGFLVQRDSSIVYDLISKLLSNDQLRRSIGEEGRRDVDNFWNWKKSTERILKIINNNL